MNGISAGEMLAWLIAFMSVLMTAAVALRTLIEVTIKPAIGRLEGQFNIPVGTRKWILPVIVLGAGLYSAYQSGINLFADFPLPIFDTMPGYFIWILNGAVLSGAAMLSNDVLERIALFLKTAKQLADIVGGTSAPQDTARLISES